jgi:L-iditol 2-dehydrogenase
MKAAVLEDVGKLVIKDVAKPKCGDDEILIKVEACAICGTDIKIYHHGHRLIKLPRITGHEVSGTVVEAGKNVSGYKPGDRVAVAAVIPCGECQYCLDGIQSMCDNLKAIGYHYDGGFAEYMLVPSLSIKNGCVNILAPNISFGEAAIAEPLACAINGQELSRPKLGDVVVIIGAGPVGCFHVQLAKAQGARCVILIDVSEERLNMSKVAKPDIVINGSRENAIEKVMEETHEKGAEIVIVACSSGKAQEDGLQMVAKRGCVNLFGGLPKYNQNIKYDSIPDLQPHN